MPPFPEAPPTASCLPRDAVVAAGLLRSSRAISQYRIELSAKCHLFIKAISPLLTLSFLNIQIRTGEMQVPVKEFFYHFSYLYEWSAVSQSSGKPSHQQPASTQQLIPLQYYIELALTVGIWFSRIHGASRGRRRDFPL